LFDCVSCIEISFCLVTKMDGLTCVKKSKSDQSNGVNVVTFCSR